MMGSVARTVLRGILARVHIGTIAVTWSDGSSATFGGETAGPQAEVFVHDEVGLVRALSKKGAVGLAVGYFDGAWTTPDLATFLEVSSRNLDARSDDLRSRRWANNIRDYWDRRPHRMRSRAIQEIGDHYNLGNDFYATWLDESMTYSSAIWASDADTLEQAQAEKYERLCRLLDLKDGERVLEIGCGWGGFAEYAASNYGVHVTGLTLSTEHAAFATNRLAEAGLGEQTEIKIQDFRDERAMYDKVVSIEMIESVDETNWPPLFNTIARSLPPGGKAAMQAITIDERFYESLLTHTDFIKTYIFPGGALPSVSALKELVAEAGLSWVSADSHGQHYARTLHEWVEQFEKAWPEIVSDDSQFDETFRLIWRYYLEYCEAGFRTGRIDGYQILMERPLP
jgi:cyclopropane-fatty-acyl-phospholipid synthase